MFHFPPQMTQKYARFCKVSSLKILHLCWNQSRFLWMSANPVQPCICTMKFRFTTERLELNKFTAFCLPMTVNEKIPKFKIVCLKFDLVPYLVYLTWRSTVQLPLLSHAQHISGFRSQQSAHTSVVMSDTGYSVVELSKTNASLSGDWKHFQWWDLIALKLVHRIYQMFT